MSKLLLARSQPPIKRADAVVYAALALLIGGLFWAFVLVRPASPLERVDVFIGDRAREAAPIFSYLFTNDQYDMLDDAARDIRVQARADGYDVLFATEQHPAGPLHYNTLVIQKSGEAYMADADCSRRKDCTRFPRITSGEQMIVCVPHRLTVLGVGGGDQADDGLDAIIG